MARILFIFVLLVSPGLSEQVNAQDLEPRRWSHLPSGLNIVGVGYVYTQADIFVGQVNIFHNNMPRRRLPPFACHYVCFISV